MEHKPAMGQMKENLQARSDGGIRHMTPIPRPHPRLAAKGQAVLVSTAVDYPFAGFAAASSPLRSCLTAAAECGGGGGGGFAR